MNETIAIPTFIPPGTKVFHRDPEGAVRQGTVVSVLISLEANPVMYAVSCSGRYVNADTVFLTAAEAFEVKS
jgi:hypothetical protein